MGGRLLLRGKKIIKALEKGGFEFQGQKGSHVSLRHPITERTVIVPVHTAEFPRWLFKKTIKDAGLSEGEFRELL